MARLNATDCKLRYEALESERKNLDGQLELLERFVMPGKGRFFQEGLDAEESVDWRHRELYDGTAQNSNTLLAANSHSALTSGAMTWFELTFRQDELNESKEAAEWLQDSAERLRADLNDSNFDLEANEFYQEASGMGTAIMLHAEGDSPVPLEWGGHRFSTEMLRQCYFEEDMDGRPTALFIKRSYTVMQLALKFGIDKLPQRLREKMDNDSNNATDKSEECTYCIYLDPDRKDADVSEVMPPDQRPYAGRWLLNNSSEFIGDEQGFYEFPAYVLRWQRTAASKYGHCPGIIALGDILTLQEMVEMVRNATEKTVDPPMKHTTRGVIGDVEMIAGGLTAVREMDGIQPLMPPGAYRVDAGWQDIQDLRARIEKYFYVDQLQLKDSPSMTATEASIRYDMMQRLLGPTVGRVKSDFQTPLVERCFWMMYRKGALKQMPQIVRDNAAELDIEFTGPLSRAQKMSQMDGIQQWVALTGQIAQVKPQVLDNVDEDAIAKHTGEILGVPAKMMRSEEEVKTIREERKKQAEQAQQMAQMEQASNVAKNVGQSGLADGGGGLEGMMPEGQPVQ